MQAACKRCTTNFEITGEELDLLSRAAPVFDGNVYPLPAPAYCPNCRNRRRLMFRNERKLYHRTCSSSGKSIISIFSPDKPYAVYENEIWWGGAWDPLAYGRECDFNRPFFDQFAELYRSVPKAARVASNNENSDYVNYALQCKNCYMLLGWGENSEQCMYGKLVINCRECVDISHAVSCELCYASVDIENCYQIGFSQSCKNSSESYYLKNCVSCSNCFGCINLANKQYCLYNEQLTKQAYLQRVTQLLHGLRTESSRREIEGRVQQVWAGAPHKYYQGINTENCIGDYLRNCKNAQYCFDTSDTEDGIHLFDCIETRDCMDLSFAGKNKTELSYQCVNYTGTHCLFASLVWLSNDLTYCQDCFHGCHDCFGCTGLTHKSYCILNRQYSKEEYHRVAAKIAEHMQRTGEWGEFFPQALAPFGYNESMACEYYPLSESAAQSENLVWSHYEGERKTVADKTAADLDRAEGSYADEILNWVLECAVSGKPFRITRQELMFYRKLELPLPRLHPDERHNQRREIRNARKLYPSECTACKAPYLTTFAPGRAEETYCESCFQKMVYA